MATREELQSLRGRVEQLSEEHVYSPATSFTSLLAILSEVLDHLIQERYISGVVLEHLATSDAFTKDQGFGWLNSLGISGDDPDVPQVNPGV